MITDFAECPGSSSLCDETITNCVDGGGSYQCQCKNGFVLQDDGVTCGLYIVLFDDENKILKWRRVNVFVSVSLCFVTLYLCSCLGTCVRVCVCVCVLKTQQNDNKTEEDTLRKRQPVQRTDRS